MTTITAIADTHGNLPALEAVLEQPDVCDSDAIYHAGDSIGILGFNDDVVETLREDTRYNVVGNHDLRVLPRAAYSPSFPAAHDEMRITTSQLGEEHIEHLQSLPDRVSNDDVVLAHARPFFMRDPGFPVHGYAQGDTGLDAREFTRIGPHLDGRVAIVGHTHDQHAVDCSKFEGQSGLVLNPGSVGVPWFGEASYAIVDLDTQEYELCSVPFDNDAVEERLRELDSPPGKFDSDRRSHRL
jgi:putative phosphoesterase